MMREVLQPTQYNVAAGIVVVGLLVVAYVVVPHRLVQYGAWLLIFTIWMTWFVYAGVDYIYGIE